MSNVLGTINPVAEIIATVRSSLTTASPSPDCRASRIRTSSAFSGGREKMTSTWPGLSADPTPGAPSNTTVKWSEWRRAAPATSLSKAARPA